MYVGQDDDGKDGADHGTVFSLLGRPAMKTIGI